MEKEWARWCVLTWVERRGAGGLARRELGLRIGRSGFVSVSDKIVRMMRVGALQAEVGGMGGREKGEVTYHAAQSQPVHTEDFSASVTLCITIARSGRTDAVPRPRRGRHGRITILSIPSQPLLPSLIPHTQIRAGTPTRTPRPITTPPRPCRERRRGGRPAIAHMHLEVIGIDIRAGAVSLTIPLVAYVQDRRG